MILLMTHLTCGCGLFQKSFCVFDVSKHHQMNQKLDVFNNVDEDTSYLRLGTTQIKLGFTCQIIMDPFTIFLESLICVDVAENTFHLVVATMKPCMFRHKCFQQGWEWFT